LLQGKKDNINGIFDGQFSNTSKGAVIFKALESGILLYMEAPTNKEVQTGNITPIKTIMTIKLTQVKCMALIQTLKLLQMLKMNHEIGITSVT
jgi:hypothetical protein